MLDPNSQQLAGIETPALILDVEALRRNISRMADHASATGTRLRPHAKTHKSPKIAQMQLDAGAAGISCATVSELEAMAACGMTGLLLTSPVADKPKLQRLVGIASRNDISIVVDHQYQIAALGELLGEGSRPIRVLVDIDVGQRRTGVCDTQATVELARSIRSKAVLRFGGVQGFAGQVQHLVNPIEREGGASRTANLLKEHLDALRCADINAEIITGSGTGTFSFDNNGPYTELQVGSYVFMDADYGRIEQKGGGSLPFEASLLVLATVTSINRPGEFTVDAGVKALAHNGPAPDGIIGAAEGAVYRFAGDEHGIVTKPSDDGKPLLGSRVLMKTTHCDPTVNLYSVYHVVDSSHLLEEWPIVARY